MDTQISLLILRLATHASISMDNNFIKSTISDKRFIQQADATARAATDQIDRGKWIGAATATWKPCGVQRRRQVVGW